MPSGGAALIKAVKVDTATISTDQQAITAAQAVVTVAQGQLTADQTKQQADNVALAAFLSANGPQVDPETVVVGSTAIDVYMPDAAPPGYIIQQFAVAS